MEFFESLFRWPQDKGGINPQHSDTPATETQAGGREANQQDLSFFEGSPEGNPVMIGKVTGSL